MVQGLAVKFRIRDIPRISRFKHTSFHADTVGNKIMNEEQK